MMIPIQKEILEVKSAPRAEFLLPGILSMVLTHLGGYHLTAVLNENTKIIVCIKYEVEFSESYDAEPDCAPSGSISGFTFINFVM